MAGGNWFLIVAEKIRLSFRLIEAIVTSIAFACLCQTALAQASPDLTGNWQGSVEAGRGFRVLLQISPAVPDQAPKGAWRGIFYSIGVVGTRELDIPSIMRTGSEIRFEIAPVDGRFEGKLNTDGREIAGTLKYGAGSYPLTLERARPDTAWPIPDATAHMPENATPEFEVATIKPTDPDWHSQGFHIRGRQISCDNETVDDMISFAYGVHTSQIAGGPGWLGSDKYTVEGVPDLVGQPNMKQMRAMYQSLLASRFNLTMHHETRELSVLALRVSKDGPKMAKSLGDPKGGPDQTITRRTSQLIELRETNATMSEFPSMLAWVLEKPVVDQTGLSGRFDFILRWTPDGARVDDPSAPPGLFTAIQEQIGLKLESTKAPTDMLVIDHVDKPSPN